MKKMYTCNGGRNRSNNGENFWAWDDDTLEDNKFIIEVEEDSYEVDDVGLYYIIDLSKVNWIEIAND